MKCHYPTHFSSDAAYMVRFSPSTLEATLVTRLGYQGWIQYRLMG